MRNAFALLFFIFSAFGCASLPGSNTMGIAIENGMKKEVSIDPVNFVGVQWTDAVRDGKYRAYLANFPQELFSEFHPLRIRYNAVAYGEISGKEYPAQALYTGYAQCALRLVFIVEGNPDEPVIGAIVTTRFTKAYSLYGEPIFFKTPEKLVMDAAYRKEVVLSGGTPVQSLKGVPVNGAGGLQAMFEAWGTAKVKSLGDQRTPLEEKFVRMVARDNPEYSFAEKLTGNGSFGLTLSWFGIAMGAAQDVIMSAAVTDKGWDENSELKRGYQGMIAQVVAAQYQAAIDAGMSCSGPRTKALVQY